MFCFWKVVLILMHFDLATKAIASAISSCLAIKAKATAQGAVGLTKDGRRMSSGFPWDFEWF